MEAIRLSDLATGDIILGWTERPPVGKKWPRADVELKVVVTGDAPRVDIRRLYGGSVEGPPVNLLGCATDRDNPADYTQAELLVGSYVVIFDPKGPMLLCLGTLKKLDVVKEGLRVRPVKASGKKPTASASRNARKP